MSGRGLLKRRPVQARSITHIGKEANLLDEIQAGLIGDDEQVLTEYHDQQLDPFVCLVLPIVRDLPLAQLTRETGLDPATIKRIRSRTVQPSTTSRELLTRYAGTYAREQLAHLLPAHKPDRDDLTACARYLAQRPERACPVCGKPPAAPRATYCSRACRDRAYRSRR